MATIATVAVVATTRRSHNVQGEVYIGLNYLASPKNPSGKLGRSHDGHDGDYAHNQIREPVGV